MATPKMRYSLNDAYIDHVFAQNLREYKLSDTQREHIWDKAEECGHMYEKEDLEIWIREAQNVKK